MIFVFFSLISLQSYNWWVHSISREKLIAISRCLSTDLDVLWLSTILYPCDAAKSFIWKPNKSMRYKMLTLFSLWYSWDDMQMLLLRKPWKILYKKKEGFSENYLSFSSFWQILVILVQIWNLLIMKLITVGIWYIYCISFVLPLCGKVLGRGCCRRGFCEETSEASLMWDRVSAIQLQDGPAAGCIWSKLSQSAMVALPLW